MTVVQVSLDARSYEVRIECGLIDQAGDHLRPFARGGRLIIVSDENVWAAQGERLVRALGTIEPLPIVLAAGEASKSWSSLAELIDRLLELGVERGDHLIAFGGGVIGDLTGFAAAIVKRGCGFIQLPTSLLAQVDSSIGGKTAINVPAGKNMVGAFHQPALVLIDPGVLDSLPEREVRAGYAEIVKYALIEDRPFFDALEASGPAALAGNVEALSSAIAKAVSGKARIVAEDERETSGTRALLNLGHTFGHALEAEAGFSDRLLHGEAVAAGIALAFDFSVESGLCPSADAQRVTAHFEQVGLPASLASAGIAASGARLVEHMMHDKKLSGGRLPFILARGIGRAFVDRAVDLSQIELFLDRHA